MEVGSPKQKDLMRKRTESLDSIEKEIETMQHKSEPELEVENSPVSRGLGKGKFLLKYFNRTQYFP